MVTKRSAWCWQFLKSILASVVRPAKSAPQSSSRARCRRGVAGAVLSVAKHLPKVRDVKAEAAFLHGNAGPTWFIRSLLPMTSFGATAVPPKCKKPACFVRPGMRPRLKGPNDMTSLVGVAGVVIGVVFFYNFFISRTVVRTLNQEPVLHHSKRACWNPRLQAMFR
jgi:hypothetical protein